MARDSNTLDWLRAKLRSGLVIPAHPLALTGTRRLDERRQRALTKYYHASGAGGVAVAVHTTQFAIRDPGHALLRPVLELAADTLRSVDSPGEGRMIRIAGVCGRTPQALREAVLARELGYDAGLLSLAALAESSDDELLAHCGQVGREIPLVGFYLQTAVGGRNLSRDFWRRFADIPEVVAIKIAPFNRYQSLDVIRAVAESGRSDEIALYTGNDDSIVADLITQYAVQTMGSPRLLHFSGGLLGHWACWTSRAVELLSECSRWRPAPFIPSALLTRAAEITDSNAAVFDAAHGFKGCIAGIHEVLRRQGLLAGTWCLDPNEQLSPGQAAEIDRVCHAYPHLVDDEFVARNIDSWMR